MSYKDNPKKNLKAVNDHKKMMEEKGFIRRCKWYHQDDEERIKKYIDKLNKMRK